MIFPLNLGYKYVRLRNGKGLLKGSKRELRIESYRVIRVKGKECKGLKADDGSLSRNHP